MNAIMMKPQLTVDPYTESLYTGNSMAGRRPIAVARPAMLQHIDSFTDTKGISAKRRMKDMSNCTLSEYVDFWMQTFKRDTLEESTIDRYITSIGTMRKYRISQMRIADITAMEIKEYMDELVEAGYALTTIKKLVRIATAPLKQAAALHHIPADPSVGLRFPREERVEKHYQEPIPYTQEEQEKLWAVLDTKKRWGYYVIGFMLETGTRVGEALALEWSDIDFERKGARICKTVARLANQKQSKVKMGAKTKSSNRTVPLTPKALELLEELRKTAPNEYVFTNEYGERLSYEALRYQTQRACKAAGIEYRGEHVFRHTYATNHYKKNTNIKILSKVLGHSSVAITQDIYIHLEGDGFDEMYSALVSEK